jgi:hypothetical protein
MWMKFIVFAIALSVIANLWLVISWVRRFRSTPAISISTYEDGSWATFRLPSCSVTTHATLREVLDVLKEVPLDHKILITTHARARLDQYPGIVTPEEREIIDRAKVFDPIRLGRD